MTLQIGDLLNNRYQINRVIAANVDTFLYRAFDSVQKSEVRIKESLAASPENWQDLLDEVALFASLRHPNLMRIADHFDIPGQGVYQVTDLLDPQRVYNPSAYPKGMPVREVVPAILTICDVLNYLHQNHPPIIHGEVNLETINVLSDGQVILSHPRWFPSGRTDIDDMQEVENPAPDIRNDIFDLGSASLTLLTNQTIEGNTAGLTEDVLQDYFRQANPPVPDGIGMVLAKALNQDPDLRFQTIEEFKSALLNAVIFMPAESAANPLIMRSPPVNLPADESVTAESVEPEDTPARPEILPRSTTPIRRRVPWGMLILPLVAGAAWYLAQLLLK